MTDVLDDCAEYLREHNAWWGWVLLYGICSIPGVVVMGTWHNPPTWAFGVVPQVLTLVFFGVWVRLDFELWRIQRGRVDD